MPMHSLVVGLEQYTLKAHFPDPDDPHYNCLSLVSTFRSGVWAIPVKGRYKGDIGLVCEDPRGDALKLDRDLECHMLFIPRLPVPPSSLNNTQSVSKIHKTKANTCPPPKIVDCLTALQWSELYNSCLVATECLHPDCARSSDCELGDCFYIFKGHTICHPTGLAVVHQKFKDLKLADTIPDRDFVLFTESTHGLNLIVPEWVLIPQSWSLKAKEEVTVLNGGLNERVGKIYSTGSSRCFIEFKDKELVCVPLRQVRKHFEVGDQIMIHALSAPVLEEISLKPWGDSYIATTVQRPSTRVIYCM